MLLFWFEKQWLSQALDQTLWCLLWLLSNLDELQGSLPIDQSLNLQNLSNNSLNLFGIAITLLFKLGHTAFTTRKDIEQSCVLRSELHLALPQEPLQLI